MKRPHSNLRNNVIAKFIGNWANALTWCVSYKYYCCRTKYFANV